MEQNTTLPLRGLCQKLLEWSPGCQWYLSWFCGRNVTVVTPSKHTHLSAPQGFSTNYSMWQRGLTVDIICQSINPSTFEAQVTPVLYIPRRLLRTVPLLVFACGISANCGTSMLMTQSYVLMVDASGNGSSSERLSSVRRISRT
ncbi:hypothetical protein BDR03DRAFT_959754 [Suillus americanus]|nr:hypothetical protein BDR03DRAFT_959754 [Suillus americanus]